MQKPSVLPVNFAGIPDAMASLDRWIMWRWEADKNRGGKFGKVPRNPAGWKASTSKEKTWSTFSEVRKAYMLGDFDGVGLVLPKGVVGVDLDECYRGEDKTFTQQAKMLLSMLPTYAEISPSGNGVKLLTTGALNDGLRKSLKGPGGAKPDSIELYDGATTNRYFAMTGQVMENREAITGQRDSLFAIQSLMTEAREAEKEKTLKGDKAEKGAEYLDQLNPARCDDYHDWLYIGMAAHWCDDSLTMFEKWVDYSRKSPNFESYEHCLEKWESFTSNRGDEARALTDKYLERLAKEDGYNPGKYVTGALTGPELLNRVIVRDYIVEDFLVKNEPMIIGGASKAMKTTLALELALSITTGTPFLGHFGVKQKRPVMFLSGESGEATLQENLRMLAASKGVAESDTSLLSIGFKLPKLDDVNYVDDLLEELEEKGIDTVFIDPLYRSLRVGDSASNVYAMGEKLELIAERIHKAGVTVILLHHFKKQGKSHSEAPELEDLSQSGVAEFGRQFLLLKRREAYAQDGRHTLWFTWGGSAGHQGAMVLEAQTGTREGGLTWSARLMTRSEYEAEKGESKQAEKEASEEDAKGEVLTLIKNNPRIITSEIQSQLKKKHTLIRSILDELEDENLIESEVGKRNAKHWFESVPRVRPTLKGNTPGRTHSKTDL